MRCGLSAGGGGVQAGFPESEEAGEAAEQEGGDGVSSAVGVLGRRKKLKAGGAESGASEVAEANDGFMNSTVLAFGVAGVHGIKQRREIDQARGCAEEELGRYEDGDI